MKLYKYLVMAALAVSGMAITSCDNMQGVVDNIIGDGPFHMWKITIQGEGVTGGKAVIPLGQTLQLKLDIVPTNATIIDPIWTSADESVATVDADGLVTALKSGETIIHVYSEYNPDIFDDLRLIVSGGAISISSEAVDQAKAE